MQEAEDCKGCGNGEAVMVPVLGKTVVIRQQNSCDHTFQTASWKVWKDTNASLETTMVVASCR